MKGKAYMNYFAPARMSNPFNPKEFHTTGQSHFTDFVDFLKILGVEFLADQKSLVHR